MWTAAHQRAGAGAPATRGDLADLAGHAARHCDIGLRRARRARPAMRRDLALVLLRIAAWVRVS